MQDLTGQKIINADPVLHADCGPGHCTSSGLTLRLIDELERNHYLQGEYELAFASLLAGIVAGQKMPAILANFYRHSLTSLAYGVLLGYLLGEAKRMDAALTRDEEHH